MAALGLQCAHTANHAFRTTRSFTGYSLAVAQLADVGDLGAAVLSLLLRILKDEKRYMESDKHEIQL
jgi:hypothetical protein